MAISKKKSSATAPRLVVADAAIDVEIDIDAGFQRLLRHFKDPHVAAERLNAALRTNKVKLLADGNEVHVDFIVTHLVVVARQAVNDGPWTVEVDSTGRAFERPKVWSVPAAKIDALIENDAEPKPQRAGGRPPYDRNKILAVAFAELAGFIQRGGILKDYSGNKWAADVAVNMGDKSPGDTVLKEILNPIFQHI
jgi:hypothetical protein